MKPIIIYPLKEDEDTITIKKSYLESIIEQVYQQGVSDGNVNYNKQPVYRGVESTTSMVDKHDKIVRELVDKCDLHEVKNGKAYTF